MWFVCVCACACVSVAYVCAVHELQAEYELDNGWSRITWLLSATFRQRTNQYRLYGHRRDRRLLRHACAGDPEL